MPTLEEAIRIKEQVVDQLVRIPGVVGVGVGPKIRDGQATGEIVLMVFVRDKLPLDQIPPEHRIPDEIQGLKTDVLIGAAPQRIEYKNLDGRKFRADEGGVRGGIRLASDSFGTLGCIAQRTTPAGLHVFALTNAHVVNRVDPLKPDIAGQFEKTGGSIGQPSLGDCDCCECCSDVLGKTTEAHWNDVIDSAIVRIKAGVAYVHEIEGIGVVTGTVAPTSLPPADIAGLKAIVRKRGARSLLTRGVVLSVSVDSSIPEQLEFDDPANPKTKKKIAIRTPKSQVHIVPAPPFKYFVDSGDSGSVTVDAQSRVLCLNWAKAEHKDATTKKVLFARCTAAPIDAVLAAYSGLTICQATTPGQIHVVPKVQGAAEELAEPALPIPAHPTMIAVRDRILSTDQGRAHLDLVQRHRDEVQRLITTEARVAAIWKRHRGGRLGSKMVSSLYYPDLPVFRGMDASAVREGLDEIMGALQRYASPELRADLDRVRPMVLNWTERSVDEIITEIEAIGNVRSSMPPIASPSATDSVAMGLCTSVASNPAENIHGSNDLH